MRTMLCNYDGKQYRIRFKHIDRRVFEVREGEKVLVEFPKSKAVRKLGRASTTCAVFEQTGGGKEELVATSTVKVHPGDQLIWAHGRFYALEQALLQIADLKLRRALRKTYYATTSWRPDGRDGYVLEPPLYHGKAPMLVRV